MIKIMAVTNQKGGVGKTTTAINLATALGLKDKKVLIIDMDPQGNTTSGLGLEKRNLEFSIYDIFISRASAEQVIINLPFKNLDIIPANMHLAGAELEISDKKNRESLLKDGLNPIIEKYDYIILDCPPSLGLITTNALCFSNSVVVPVQCEFYALEGLSQLINTIKIIKREFNPNLELEGILLTMADFRLKLTKQVEQEIKKHFAGRFFLSTIPRSVKLSESPGFGKPIFYFDKSNKAAKAYENLAEEILKKEE